MGKKSRKKRMARLRALRKMQNQPAQPVHENVAQEVSQKSSETNETPTISLEDPDIAPPKSPVASEVKKIAILMTSLAAIVVLVAILNAQTNYINIVGQKLMQVLHIYGS